jgi:hypothetical protein
MKDKLRQQLPREKSGGGEALEHLLLHADMV